ncbi:penicillin-binding transpeptidase domain-containing protein [Porcipelethomonas sp.]|uniref:penicillin-binding transpeptidase domain-containing protein n=1 Tax=Porcipelethomonas sp. TaxID=2981675 RepID=UPI003EF4290F
MKSLKRGSNLITLMLLVFIIGLCLLVVKIQMEASFYISNSGSRNLGYIYDRNGDIIFDDNAQEGQYEDGYFKDLGNLIGDASGQMTNTLVARNIEKLSNYSFTSGITNKGGKAAIYSTINHDANEKVYSAFGDKEGCAIAYNYKTGEILICVSRPSVDPLKGYEDLEEGSLLCKAFYKTVPGSTQKVATLISATETMGMDKLMEKSYTCNGVYTNKTGLDIVCHNSYGHGTQNIREAFANSCNPFFAQLVEDPDWSLADIENCYKKLGYSVNGSQEGEISIDGIISEKASTTLSDKNEFNTQWSCIGQGTSLVSPCQMMMWQSAIANESGKSTMPYLIDHVTNVNGRTVETASTSYSEQLFTEKTASDVKDIMLENGLNYTGKIPGYTLGVKSGTAQVKDGEEENSLLTGFVDDEDFPIAFAILIENRQSYDISTESIASVILDSLN